VLVFVEVRLRGNAAFGGPGASITADKRRRLLHTAHHYLQRLSPLPPCRFDVVLLSSLGNGDPEWIRNAFGDIL
jgi:putative endonuclease